MHLPLIKTECGGIMNIIEDFFSFKGRIRRSTFFIRMLILFIINFIILFGIGFMIFILAMAGIAENAIMTLMFIIMIPIMLLFSALSIIQYGKRLHDLNQSAILVVIILVSIIPYIGWVISFIFGLYLLLVDGTVGPNQYGEDPKGRLPYQPYTSPENMQQHQPYTPPENMQQYQPYTPPENIQQYQPYATQENMQQYQSDTTQEDTQQ
jgi:uncharacterized membrane protein YhaH (DUF805 family)